MLSDRQLSVAGSLSTPSFESARAPTPRRAKTSAAPSSTLPAVSMLRHYPAESPSNRPPWLVTAYDRTHCTVGARVVSGGAAIAFLLVSMRLGAAAVVVIAVLVHRLSTAVF